MGNLGGSNQAKFFQTFVRTKRIDDEKNHPNDLVLLLTI